MVTTDPVDERGWSAVAAQLVAAARRPATARVLVVDDDALFAELVSVALEANGRFHVVGHARDGREAVEQAAWLRPDVVVMDVQMPVVDGLVATPRVLAAAPGSRVVVVSSSDTAEVRVRARAAGAVAFLAKRTSVEELARALERIVFRVVPLRPPGAAFGSADHSPAS